MGSHYSGGRVHRIALVANTSRHEKTANKWNILGTVTRLHEPCPFFLSVLFNTSLTDWCPFWSSCCTCMLTMTIHTVSASLPSQLFNRNPIGWFQVESVVKKWYAFQAVQFSEKCFLEASAPLLAFHYQITSNSRLWDGLVKVFYEWHFSQNLTQHS